MRVHAIWQPLPLLGVLAFLVVGCDRPAPTDSDQPTLLLQTTDDGLEILSRYRDELWPCPPGYRPIQIEEFVASSPPPKLPGDPEYWEECPAEPGFATNHNSSVGTASHLGEIRNEWDACLDFSTFTGFFDAQLTAADGDRLDWEITATATPLPGGGRYSVTTGVSFDGGTGRFANATGYAAGEGRSVPGEGESLYYVGCLAY